MRLQFLCGVLSCVLLKMAMGLRVYSSEDYYENWMKKKTSHSKTDRQAHGSTQQALALLLPWPKMVRDGNV